MPATPTMQRTLNLKVKKREGFRPFAPAVLAEHADEWFDLDGPSPYMTFVAPVPSATGWSLPHDPGSGDTVTEVGSAEVRSAIPAVTHVDGSARIQTVDDRAGPRAPPDPRRLRRRTGLPGAGQHSFNVRGEPIVATPEDAYRCFMTTDMDWLVLEDCLLARDEQPPWTGPALEIEPD